MNYMFQALDGADDLMAAEKEQLLKLKRVLESQLRSVQKQLQVLDNARKRIKAVTSERSKVLDLICYSVSSVPAVSSTMGSSALDVTSNKRSHDSLASMEADPLGPYTPEVKQVMSLATDARQRSTNLRKEVSDAIEQVQKLQKLAHKYVNDGLTKKISETIAVKVRKALEILIFVTCQHCG